MFIIILFLSFKFPKKNSLRLQICISKFQNLSWNYDLGLGNSTWWFQITKNHETSRSPFSSQNLNQALEEAPESAVTFPTATVFPAVSEWPQVKICKLRWVIIIFCIAFDTV